MKTSLEFDVRHNDSVERYPCDKTSIARRRASLFSMLQLIVPLPSLAEIGHHHDVDHQACPTRKVLSPLTLTGLWVVLLPCEAGLLPLAIDVLYKITPKLNIDLSSLLLMRARNLSNVLNCISSPSRQE